jgi:amino acid adenylation domain-containing protein
VIEIETRTRELSREQLDLLIRRLAERPPAEPGEDRIPSSPASAGPAPLSPDQERLWFLHLLDPASPAYNLAARLRLRGGLEPLGLERSLRAIVRRHDSLRTVVEAGDDGRVAQRLLAVEEVARLPRVDLSRLPRPSSREEARRLAQAHARRPFDLTRGPLFRLALLARGTERDLLLSVHHLVSDGWSIGVFLEELRAEYGSAVRGVPSGIPGPAVRYGDFAAWQWQRLRSGAFEGPLRHWQERLDGAPRVELPADRPRPPELSGRGERLPIALDRRLTGSLQRIASGEGTTLFAALLGGFQVLLQRYTGEDDVVVGSVVAGRQRPEVERVIGFFANTLALRTDLAGAGSFREVVRRAEATVVDALRHQEAPFAAVAARLAAGASLGTTPFFGIMLSMDARPGGGLRLGSVEGAVEELSTGTAKFDLAVHLVEREGEVRGALEYSTDLFDRSTAARLWRHLERLLAAAAAEPEAPLDRLPLTGGAERHLLLHEWSERERPRPEALAEGFSARVRARAALQPHTVAVEQGGERLSYGELVARAGRIAGALGRMGVVPEDRVAWLLDEPFGYAEAFLGTLEAGAVYLPLDPGHPEPRLAALLAEARPRVAVVRRAGRGAPDVPGAVPVVAFEDLERGGEERGGAEPEPARLAYVLYTSGSTGRPKGVAVTHAGLANLAGAHAALLGLDAGDRVLQFAPLIFDASISELAATLAAGATLVLARRQDRIPGTSLARLLADRRITCLKLPPSSLAQVPRSRGAGALPDLGSLASAGEACPPALIESWGRDRRMFNVYGPTECTVTAAIGKLRPGEPVTIGGPLPGLRARILDRRLRPAPVGVAGELCLAGAGTARGYLAQPGVTAERFVPDPYPRAEVAAPGERLYRTGDLARWLPCGRLQLLGRIDRQVKVRGFRVEPAEVEAALARLPQVREAVVDAAPDASGDLRLAAWVVLHEAGVAPAEAAELRRALGRALPEYLVPSVFWLLPELPRVPGGKVDRRALVSLAARPGAAEPLQGGAPRTPVERELAALFIELLGVPEVGREDDFFELGGHSLTGARLALRIRAVLGVDLPLQRIFEARTVAALAVAVAAGPGEPHPVLTALPEGPAAGPEGPFPLSFAQERLWFLDRYELGAATYNVAGALRLAGTLAPAALVAALAAVVRRHGVLRSTYREADGEPRQWVSPERPVPPPVVDLSRLPDPGREASLLAAREARRPFDLAAGPVLRSTLLRLGSRDHTLLVTVHHIASDGWSLGVMVRELRAAYGASLRSEAPELPELPLQYADFAALQRRELSGAALAKLEAFWRERLAGAPVLELATDRPRPPLWSGRGAWLPVGLGGDRLRAIRTLALREGVTPFLVLLASYGALLGRHTGQEDLVVGVPVANRDRPETQELVGFFVNTLPLRFEAGGARSFRDLLARVRQAVLGAFAHQSLPFERLVGALGVEREPGRPPLVQTVLGFQQAAGHEVVLPGLAGELVPTSTGTAKFELTLDLTDHGDRLAGWLEYATDLFDATTVRRLWRHLEVLLDGALAEPERRLSELPVLSPPERHLLTAEWSDGPGTAGPAATVGELFEERAREGPEAVALEWPGGALTYQGLARRAHGIAGALRSLGVGPGVAVALSFERSPEAVVASLGVLLAGGAYLPLDRSYPDERLGFMLADSGAAVVLVGPGAEAGAWRRLAGGAVAVRTLRELEATGRAPGPVCAGVGPGDPACLFYTSGSTGRPKGVVIRHRGIVRLVADADYLRLGPADRTAQTSSLSFDAATFEIWGALLGGGVLVLVERDVLLSPPELAADLAARRLTVVFLTTALFNQVAREAPEAFAPLDAVLFGGEAADPEAVRRALEERPPRRLLHAYGPTENTTYSTWFEVREVPAEARTVPIGRPIAGSTAYVLDSWGRPAPPGAPGELAVGGAGLAAGYHRRPAWTAAAFVPDPFDPLPGGVPGSRLYRTGDLARWLPGGALEFLGRTDFQVKIRGFRIEPGEVEAVLAGHPGVARAAVVAREDRPGERRLVAYATAGEGGRLEADELLGYLRDRLPGFMVPAACLVVDDLPLTPSGKVDRRALPAAEPAAPDEAGAAPGTATEALVARTFAQVLDRASVPLDRSFFDLGGHSLLATRVVSKLRSALGLEVPVRAVFDHPTARELAAAVDGLRATATPPVERLPPELRARGELPLSFAQERLWFLEQLEPGTPRYNVPVLLRLEGAVEPAALAAALAALVARQEALRTAFAASEGRPRQVISPPGPVPLPVVDLSALPPEAGVAALRRLAGAVARRPFDLACGPLLRAVLARLAPAAHAAVVSLHHIVADGWSLAVFLRELAELYRARREREAPRLPELPVQYADFAAWQRRWLTGEVLADQLAYWRRRLEQLPVLELPADRPMPPARSWRGGQVGIKLPAEVGDRLRALAAGRSATPFMVLLAAFQAFLARLSGQSDVAVGSPIANRTRTETEELIGFFVNTLILRTELGDDPPFLGLVDRAREVALGAYAHQDLPFERLVEELAPERELAHSPLVRVVFALQNAPAPPPGLPGLALRLEPVDTGTAKFDLTLGLVEDGGGGLTGVLEYDRDLFDATTARRLVRGFATLLRGALEEPSRPVSRLPLLAPAQLHQLLREWSDTATGYPRDAGLGALFDEQVRLRPDAVAVELGAAAVSYRELSARARRLAQELRRLGVGPESFVALLLDRSVEMVVATLATVAAGGAYAPLDPTYPRDRLAFMLEDAGAAVVLAHRHLAERIPGLLDPASGRFRGAVRFLDGGAGTGGGADPHPGLPEPGLPAGAAAYVMYTSGSTGRPKGVAVPHRAVARLVREADFARLDAGEVFLQLAPTSFDAATLEIWAPLANGGRLVLAPPGATALETLGRELAERRVTTLWLTAGLFHQMVEEQLPSLAGVRQLLAGGDVLSPRHVRRVLEELPGVRVINGYGPTENTTFTACFAMAGPADAATPVPVGRPIADSRVVVLDPGLQPVPMGVPGELYAAGDGLARGYWNLPGRTAGAFVPHPSPSEPGERLYRTGDRARWRTDGTLEFLGRLDHQLKLRGFRIEPGEVEAALASHPAIETAVVVAREDRPGDRRLVAYAIAAAGAPPTPAALREHLAGLLPAYMVPSAVVLLDALPLTANGKVDRRALPAPEAAAPAGDGGDLPATPSEAVVAAAFRAVLGLERAPLDESFFNLGGHSLLATRVVSRLARALGVEVPLRTLFERPTVRELAAALADLKERAAPPLAPLPEAVRRGGGLPLSFAQERLWFLDQLEPASARYNVPIRLDLEGDLDPAAFAAALAGVVRRHESLRTSFAVRGGTPVQEIAPPAPVPLPVVDLAALPPEGARRVLRRLARAEARRPFDLARAPLLRVLLVRHGAGSHTAVVNLHHIISDGWSMGVLLRDLAGLYRTRGAAGAAELPELPVQYADFAAWQRGWLAGEVLEAQLAYWRRRLGGVPVLELPADRPVPAVRSHRGGTLALVVAPRLAGAVRELARRRSATPFMLLLAAFQAWLGRLSGRDDLAVGSPIANRTRSEIEGLVGFFVNTVVLRAELAGDPPFVEHLERARDRALEAYAHQDVPFERLVEELAPERDLAHSPLFQVLFILQNAPFARVELPGIELRAEAVETGTAKFDLTLALAEDGDALAGTLEYDRDLFDGATARRFARSWLALLEAAVAAPERPVSRLALLAPAEHQQALVEWNGPELGAPRGGTTLHARVLASAREAPDAVAVAGRTETLSYGELDRRSASLAARLRPLGVAREARVGVCLERTPRLLVALLGVLRAGGAYVPLDPEYPRERIAFMLEDAGAAVLLTEGALRVRLPEPLPALPGRGGSPVRVVALDEADPEAAAPIGVGSPPAADPEGAGNLAYVIYTSGSTGRPKGVAIEHRSACALLDWARAVFPPEELAGVLAATSVCFDLSIFELFLPLAAGGRVILARDALELASLPAAGAVTLVNTVPSAMTELARLGALPPSARTVNLAGEPLKGDLVRRILAGGTVERVLDLYGPSEDTTYSTWAPADPAEGREPTIGRPVAGTRAALLDARGEPVPLGAPGELYLGGAGLSRGYLGRPGLTAERYVPDPRAGGGADPGARLYRTGDLARHLPDGRLEFLGRIDHQVKVRGFRIELGEVEAALSAHPAVADCAVLVRGEGAGAELVAWVEPAAQGVREADLGRHLHGRLPVYMVPARFVLLDALPTTPNGKIDRRALAARALAPAPREAVYAPPRTPLEELLAAAFAEVLERDRVGIHDGFFDLGGHSLKAAGLAARLREVLETEVPLRLVFERPTVAGLAEAVAGLPQPGVAAAPALAPRPRPGGAAPLSYAQERLWVLDRIEPGNAAYGMPAAVRLRGELDLAALRRALGRVVARHESLRTRFGLEGGRPVQRVAPPRTPPLPVADLTGLPAACRSAALGRILAGASARPFDLARGPLLRALVAREEPASAVLHVTMHHIVSDGWSLAVFIDETSACYREERGGAPAALPELPVQYADYAAWQREWLSGETRELQLAYWRERLAGAPEGLELPMDRPRPAVRAFTGGRVSGRLERELTARLRTLALRERSTLFMVLLAAFDVLLQRLAGEDDVVVGTPVAGRGRREAEGLIGMFLNTLVLRTDLSGDPTFRDLLARVREVALGAYAHQDVPFEMLLDELKPERDLSRTPLFQIFFNMLELPLAEAVELPGATLEPVEVPDAHAKFDLTLYLRPRDGGIALEAVYDGGLFDAATVGRFLDQYTELLRQAAEEPERRIGSLSLLAPAAAAVLPDPRLPLDATWHGPIHEALARAAREVPDRVAVVDRDRAWTYATLALRCHRLARRLHEAGVGKGDAVAIYSHRSAALAAAVLGVLEAGAVFVILDPAYPAIRLAEMVELARPRALVILDEAGQPPVELLASLGAAARLGLGRDPEPSEAAEPAPAAVALGPDDPAYVAFTSGSTGRPKGILGRHGSLTHFLPWQCRRFDLGAGDRFSMLSGLAHDPLHRDLFTPVWLGAAVVVPDPLDIGASGRLARWMARERVTVALLTPAMAQVVTEHPPGARPETVGSLRRVFLVGDVLTVRDVERLRRLAPGATCVNLYGSTETQRAVAFHELPPAPAGVGPPPPERARQVLPLGRGMEDVQLLVLGREDALCAVGEVGEVCVRSPHLALGYLGDLELTRRRFTANPFTGPFTGREEDRIYRTGDQGRYLPDGSVAYLGRADHQVKVRGFRVELGEVQASLAAAPGVREAVVLLKTGDPGGGRLVGYVVPEPGAPRPAPAELRAFLAARLPAHAVPAGFAVLDALPLTPNRKVDRRALARIDDSSREVTVDSTPPKTRAEKTIAGIVREVLGLDALGVDDNFFDLGGNSLLLVQVHGRLEQAFERAIPMVALFNHPTVRSLAAHLGAGDAAAAGRGGPEGRHRLRTVELKEGRNRLRSRLLRMQG